MNRRYHNLVLLVSGLGGLLYGIDVGIIAGALPYLEATSGLNAGQLSVIVAAVLLGSVISTLFAGVLADWLGRRRLMALSGVLFVASIPIIALAHGYVPLVLGRLLQGVSGGLIGVVVPLYLAECLGAKSRGRGTAIFQWLLTLGLVCAALIGIYFSIRVETVTQTGDSARIFAFKDSAWRSIFWVSLPPAVLFVLGTWFVAESPRWLLRRGRREEALMALLRAMSRDLAERELELMSAVEVPTGETRRQSPRDSLLRRKYVVPFILACVILACNQATGVNSIIGYNTTILLQAGLSDVQAHWAYVVFTAVNFGATIGAVLLVDRLGRKRLLSIGSAGIVVALVAVGFVFRQTERQRVDCRAALQALVTPDQRLAVAFDPMTASGLLSASGDRSGELSPRTLEVIYSYGGFRAATRVVRSDDTSTGTIAIDRANSLPQNRIVGFFANPMANLGAARSAPLVIEHALVSPIPDERNGWVVAALLFGFMSCFAVGPGVCVWLALSELMPTRIRSNGMSIALLVNQGVSTAIAAVFLPTVGRFGYSSLFFTFAGCTVVYFVTATFLLPETSGKTLEEIERLFDPAAADLERNAEPVTESASR